MKVQSSVRPDTRRHAGRAIEMPRDTARPASAEQSPVDYEGLDAEARERVDTIVNKIIDEITHALRIPIVNVWIKSKLKHGIDFIRERNLSPNEIGVVAKRVWEQLLKIPGLMDK